MTTRPLYLPLCLTRRPSVRTLPNGPMSCRSLAHHRAQYGRLGVQQASRSAYNYSPPRQHSWRTVPRPCTRNHGRLIRRFFRKLPPNDAYFVTLHEEMPLPMPAQCIREQHMSTGAHPLPLTTLYGKQHRRISHAVAHTTSRIPRPSGREYQWWTPMGRLLPPIMPSRACRTIRLVQYGYPLRGL